MAWIEVHQTIWSHRKTLILAGLLEIDPILAAAHMIHLWTWSVDNAPDGNLTGLPAPVIAYGAGWRGDPERFVEAAVKAGFLDREGDQLRLHDWEDYAGRLIERRLQDAERKRRERAERRAKMRGDPGTPTGDPQDVRRTSAGQPQDDAQTSGHNLTLPNLTNGDQRDQGSSSNNDAAGGETDAGEELAATSEAGDLPIKQPPPGWQELLAFIDREHLPWRRSRTVLHYLEERVEEQGVDLVREAILIAIRAGKPDWNYIEAILLNWRDKGITTVDEARAEAVEWRRRRRTVDRPRDQPQPKMARGFESLRRLMEGVPSSDP